MSARAHNRQRPRTIWVSEAQPHEEDSEPCANVSETAPAIEPATSKSLRSKIQTTTFEIQKGQLNSGALHEDPWSTLDPIAEIILDHTFVLARYKEDKSRLVHVRRLELQSFAVLAFQRTIDQISHSSFRSLLGSYRHENSVFLAWEHVKVSVVQVLASRLVITAGEIIAIVKPVCGT